MEVPKDENLDPRIGDKISWDGISDSYFYVEGVAHSWSYGGELTSALRIIRFIYSLIIEGFVVERLLQ